MGNLMVTLTNRLTENLMESVKARWRYLLGPMELVYWTHQFYLTPSLGKRLVDLLC